MSRQLQGLRVVSGRPSPGDLVLVRGFSLSQKHVWCVPPVVGRYLSSAGGVVTVVPTGSEDAESICPCCSVELVVLLLEGVEE